MLELCHCIYTRDRWKQKRVPVFQNSLLWIIKIFRYFYITNEGKENTTKEINGYPPLLILTLTDSAFKNFLCRDAPLSQAPTSNKNGRCPQNTTIRKTEYLLKVLSVLY
jgi:hypothetical protein